ncbi:MAG TPA: DNA polymerase III subunit delta [Anaerohalosphaeraceae bacterium]|nr:DNA polymerase III subunit delta [Phycisphaerae bacterium]HOK96424.1 DNA polymerase III subunit delta [Anaerohalosphaeraceae bacterium]HOL32339.1 DNA polymerase III subunit delta [Anaerohalosphaeraceae bacterium]HOM74982.1 DNA polymerase III subunit delta [Anaerohalosphaeraceae bacterium]HPC63234.1 DNA polymerase III subunit delta [Anaerohalosphaeraceae bacterium]
MSKKTTETSRPFIVLCGDDPYVVSVECQRLLDSLLDQNEREMALYEPRAEEARIADILEELWTLPFLASKRIVVIKNAESFIRSNLEALEEYIENPSPSSVLILTATSWDKRTRLHKKLQKLNAVIEIPGIKTYQLPAFVSNYAQQTYGIRLDSQCSRWLVELTGDDPGRLCREIDKLAAYAAPSKTISLKDIEALIGHNRLFDAFDVIDAVSTGRTEDAISRLRRMFAADRDSEYTVIGAFGYHFRRLFRVKALMSRGTPPIQAAKNVDSRRPDDLLAQADRLSLPQLASILAELGRIDYEMKTGRTTASSAMERLIVKIISAQQK